MTRFSTTMALLLSTMNLGGCVSQLHVSKAQPDSPGIRYFLPQPFIVVTPGLDGAVTVEKVYLPDPDNEYTIVASSLLGNYTLDVNRNEMGFLELVSFHSDDSGMAKQLVQSAGAIRAAEIDAAAALAKTEAANDKEALESERAALAAAGKALNTAQLNLDIAQSRLAALLQRQKEPNPPSTLGTQILAASLAAQEALLRRDAAALEKNALATPGASLRAVRAGGPGAPEPVFFRVDMQTASVTLRQAFLQSDRLTWRAPRLGATLDDLSLLPEAQVLRPTDKSPAMTATVKANRDISTVQLASFNSVPPGLPLPPLAPLLSLRPDRVTLDIELPKGMAAGDYRIGLRFNNGASQTDQRALLIRIER